MDAKVRFDLYIFARLVYPQRVLEDERPGLVHS